MRGFRAWHTKLGRYLKDNEFYVNSDGSVCSAFETYDDEVLKIDYIEDFSRDDFDEGYVIREDDTGLKDKNGKEIYEGDVVHYTEKIAPNKSSTYEVYYDQLHAMYALSPVDGKIDVGEFYGYIMRQQYEIIGNIHENPELLEGEQ